MTQLHKILKFSRRRDDAEDLVEDAEATQKELVFLTTQKALIFLRAHIWHRLRSRPPPLWGQSQDFDWTLDVSFFE